GRRGGRVYEIDLFRAATQGLDPYGAGPGEQIDPNAALERRRIAGGQNIEQRFPQSVRCRTNIPPAHRVTGTAAIFSVEHSHACVPLILAVTLVPLVN